MSIPSTETPTLIDQIVKLVDSSREWIAVILAGLASFLTFRHRDKRNDRRLEAKIDLDLAAERYRLSPREQALQEALDQANQSRIDYLQSECSERDNRIASLEAEIRHLNEENRQIWLKAAQYKATLTGVDDDEPTGFQRPS